MGELLMRIVTALSRLLVSILCAVSIEAGTRFDFTAEGPGYAYKGGMALDATRLRVDIAEGNHPLFNEKISIISRDAGADVLVIDHGSRTYFQRRIAHIAGPLSTPRGLGPTKASRARVTKSRESLSDGGPATERHVVRAQYHLDMNVEGEKLEAEVTIEAVFDIDPKIRQRAHPWGLQYAAKTGFEQVDDAIARRIPDRLPMRQVVTITRRIAGGPAISETMTIIVSNVREENVPDGEFYAPAGYPYQEPVFAF